MSVTFFRNGNSFMLGHDQPQQRFNPLPAATYIVRASMEIGFYLEISPDFDLPKKIYGNIISKADRILNTFEDRPATTGVLLSGEKGSGKTLLTKLISTKGIQKSYPTIIINTAYKGDAFNTFLQKIEQPCILLFDEFEKVYDDDSQKDLLTLFDGIFTTKKLILLTSNEYKGINSHMQNRPGRIYYNLEFNGLGEDFVEDYGGENLKNQKFMKDLGALSCMINPLSFDILQAIIEESNRYNESPFECIDMLNVKRYSFKEEFGISLYIDDKLVSVEGFPKNTRVNPFKAFSINWSTKTSEKDEDGEYEYENHSLIFSPEHLVSFDGFKGIYTYKSGNNKLILTKSFVDTESDLKKYSQYAI